MGKSNEEKMWINRLRSRFSRKNGVISKGRLDSPRMNRKHFTSKHLKANEDSGVRRLNSSNEMA